MSCMRCIGNVELNAIHSAVVKFSRKSNFLSDVLCSCLLAPPSFTSIPSGEQILPTHLRLWIFSLYTWFLCSIKCVVKAMIFHLLLVGYRIRAISPLFRNETWKNDDDVREKGFFVSNRVNAKLWSSLPHYSYNYTLWSLKFHTRCS